MTETLTETEIIERNRAVAERFLKAEHRAMVLLEREPEALIDRLQGYQLPQVSKWIDRGQT